jgi:hypothetical protein
VHSQDRRAPWGSRVAAIVAAAVLAALGAMYYFTYEPAPQVAVQWNKQSTWDQRMALERGHRLVRPRDQEGPTLTYDLVDVRIDNIQPLLARPEVVDIRGIDRRQATIPADAPYGVGWMWVGNRLPVLRSRGVVPAIVLACSLVVVYALTKEVRARRKRVLRLLAVLLGSRSPRFQDAGERLTDRRGVVP